MNKMCHRYICITYKCHLFLRTKHSEELSVTEDGLTAETGLTINIFCGIDTSITLHLMMNFHFVEKKIIS